jgi:hypothetical protein
MFICNSADAETYTGLPLGVSVGDGYDKATNLERSWIAIVLYHGGKAIGSELACDRAYLRQLTLIDALVQAAIRKQRPITIEGSDRGDGVLEIHTINLLDSNFPKPNSC